MSTKRSTLPPVTQLDLTRTPERLRATPNGGYAWKCYHCGEFASSETQAGRYVCRRHGGTTPRQRDPKLVSEAAERGELVRPPGRPITTGKHSSGPRRTVHELVHEYQQELGDADATDEHMLHLRAYLDTWIAQRDDEDAIAELLERLQNASDDLTRTLRDAQGLYPDNTDQVLWKLTHYAHTLFPTRDQYRKFHRVTREIEKRHARLIRLTNVRTDTREKHAALHQLQEFTQTLPKVLALLEPRVDPGTRQKLQARLQVEFRTLPERTLTQNTMQVAQPRQQPEQPGEDAPEIEFLAYRLQAFGVAPDDPRLDLLYLKAYLKTLTSLANTVRDTGRSLTRLEDELDRFLQQEATRPDGDAASVTRVLEEYRSLKLVQRTQRTITEVRELFAKFDAEHEDRHARIIELAQTRADILLKEQRADKLTLQRHLLRRLHQVLLEVLTPDDVTYVTAHLLQPSNPSATALSPSVPTKPLEREVAEVERTPRQEKHQT